MVIFNLFMPAKAPKKELIIMVSKSVFFGRGIYLKENVGYISHATILQIFLKLCLIVM